jgi:hypothetical protein
VDLKPKKKDQIQIREQKQLKSERPDIELAKKQMVAQNFAALAGLNPKYQMQVV